MKQLVDIRSLLDKAKPNSPYWALVDAFDAAANGMENPEALARMEQVGEKDLLPWKALIHAMRALYGENPTACAAALSAMDSDSPPARLKPLFLAWIAVSESSSAKDLLTALSQEPAGLAVLYGALFAGRHPLVLLAEQAQEALFHGMLDQYEALVHRILRELQDQRGKNGPAASIRYALYCVEQAERHGCQDSFLYPLLLRSLGRSDGFCAIGLSLAEHDGAAAAIALRGALESEDGVFLDGDMRPAMEALAADLEGSTKIIRIGVEPGDGDQDTIPIGSEPRDGTKNDGRYSAAYVEKGRRKKIRPPQAHQLELFAQAQGYIHGL